MIWYIFPRFGILCQEKSGNPVKSLKKLCRENWKEEKNAFEDCCGQGDQMRL
jgi:hypothetical protein